MSSASGAVMTVLKTVCLFVLYMFCNTQQLQQSDYNYEDEDTVVILAPPTSPEFIASSTTPSTPPNKIVNFPIISSPQPPTYYPPSSSKPTDIIIGPSNELISLNPAQACICVPSGSCLQYMNSTQAGIDIRIVTPVQGNCRSGYTLCCNTRTCGLRAIVTNAPYPPNDGYAPYGAYPWVVALLTQANEYIGGGVIVDQYHILTAAHKVAAYRFNTLTIKLRIGEWNSATILEPYKYVETGIDRMWLHPDFDPVNLTNDIALIRLQTPISLFVTPNINSICLPGTTTTDFGGQRCWVAGWGKNSFVGTFETILKHVQVTIIDGYTCEQSMRRTRLGTNFQLNKLSFICAGGELNKDACTGDGGSPLVCEVGGRWTLAGLVAWGIGCAQPGVYGVYVNVPSFLTWIQYTLSISTP